MQSFVLTQWQDTVAYVFSTCFVWLLPFFVSSCIAVGDVVNEDEQIAEIETDKVLLWFYAMSDLFMWGMYVCSCHRPQCQFLLPWLVLLKKYSFQMETKWQLELCCAELMLMVRSILVQQNYCENTCIPGQFLQWTVCTSFAATQPPSEQKVTDAKSKTDTPPSGPPPSVHREAIPMDTGLSSAGPIPQHPPPVPPLPGFCALCVLILCCCYQCFLPVLTHSNTHK